MSHSRSAHPRPPARSELALSELARSELAPSVPKGVLADVAPTTLAVRLAAGCLTTGTLGGIVTAVSIGVHGPPTSVPGLVTALAVPTALLLQCARRLRADARGRGGSPSGTALAFAAVLGGAVVVLAQLGPSSRWTPPAGLASAHGLAATTWSGALLGALTGGVSFALLLPLLLLLRLLRGGTTWTRIRVALAVGAVVTAAASTLWLTLDGLGNPVVSALTTAWAGTGAVLTGRWALARRRPVELENAV